MPKRTQTHDCAGNTCGYCHPLIAVTATVEAHSPAGGPADKAMVKMLRRRQK